MNSVVSEEERARSTLGTVLGDKFITFELYMPAETPQEAKVIATLKIDLKTREVEVTVP